MAASEKRRVDDRMRVRDGIGACRRNLGKFSEYHRQPRRARGFWLEPVRTHRRFGEIGETGMARTPCAMTPKSGIPGALQRPLC